MSIVESDTNTQINVSNDDGEHEMFSHVVSPASAVTEAYVTGKPVRALCGKTWVPKRDPKRYPVCPECRKILNSVGQNV